MIQHNPIPGKINDLAQAAILLSNQEKMQELRDKMSPKKGNFVTILRKNLLMSHEFDNMIPAVSPFFFLSEGRLSPFFSCLMQKGRSCFQFASLNEFFHWLENLDEAYLIAELLRYYDEDETPGVEYEQISQNPVQLASFLQGLKLPNEKIRASLLLTCISPRLYLTYVSKLFQRLSAFLEDIYNEGRDYLQRKTQECSNEERVALLLEKLGDLETWIQNPTDPIEISLNLVADYDTVIELQPGVRCLLIGANAFSFHKIPTTAESLLSDEELEALCRAVSEKNRSEILHILEDTPADTGVFVDRLSIAYTTLIHHINILADAQLITPLTKGRNRTYVLNYEMYRLAAEAFEARYQRIMGKQNRD